MTEHLRVVIIGAGFGGLGAAIRLTRDGVGDLAVLERADDVGGTWRDNSYPGCACDVPSHLYSYSFAPNPDWSRSFSPQPEIWAYLRRTADEYGVTPLIRFGTEVTAAAWDEVTNAWQLTTNRGPLTADVLVSATGPLCEPVIPKLPGLETFAGTTFHSARWRHDHDLTGHRVAVIGTGASAAQFVPAIAPDVAHLDLYQRTPPWVMPRGDRPLSERMRRLYRTVPGLQRLARAGIYASREAFFYNFRAAKRGRGAIRTVAVQAAQPRGRYQERSRRVDRLVQCPHGQVEVLDPQPILLAPRLKLHLFDRRLDIQRRQPVHAGDRPFGQPALELLLERLGRSRRIKD